MPDPSQHLPTVEFDPNVQVNGDQTRILLERLPGAVKLGQAVRLLESEAGLAGSGRIASIDLTRRLVYITVDWGSLSYGNEANPHPPQEVDASATASATPIAPSMSQERRSGLVSLNDNFRRKARHYQSWGQRSTHVPGGYLSPAGTLADEPGTDESTRSLQLVGRG